MNTTTRRYPRTRLEAWPGSEPGSIQGPYRSDELSPLSLLIVAVLLVLLCLGAVHVIVSIVEAAP